MRSPMQRSKFVPVPLFERKTRLNSNPTSRSARWRSVFAAALVFIFGAAAHAQQSTVSLSEDFQSYGKSKKPAGWIDTKVGSLNAKPRGYYKTRIDPTQDKNGPNIVYGTTKSIADKVIGGVNRGGYFAVYQPKVFSAIGRFEVTGRMIRISTRSRAGLTVLNNYPEKDKYYLIREEATGTAAPTLRLSAFGAGTPTGRLDSGISLTSGKWYRFRIATDSVAGVTNIRARFWLDGTAEPSTYAIEASDSSVNRLVTGRFGVWAGGTDNDTDADALTPSTEANDDDDETLPPTRGTYVDDLNLKSPSDTGAPTIQFYENGLKLDPTKRTDFGRDAAIDIRIADDLSTHSYVATLDGAPYRSLDPIAAEGIHLLKVRATDAVGNFTDAQVSILIDKTKPAIALFESGSPLADNTRFKRTAAVEIRVADTYSTFTSIARLDGNLYTSLTPIAAEGPHVLLVEATDAVGNQQTKQVHLVIDLTAPVVTFFESGQSVDSTNAKFKVNPAIEIRATEPGTTVTAKLDGNPYTSQTPITVDGRHVIVATAVDAAGNIGTGTLNLLVDKVRPVVVLRESSNVLDQTKTAVFARNAAIAIDVTDATSQVEWSAKLDGANYVSGAPITEEKTHTFTLHAVDEAGNVTDVALAVLIDKTAPVVSFFNGQDRLDARTGHVFGGNVSIDITAADTDPDVTITAKLDGTSYQPKTEISTEGPHVIVVTATDTAGNIATADVTLRFVIDKTRPVIVLTETGGTTPSVLPSGSQASYNRDAKVTIAVTDAGNLGTLETTAKLDGSDYTSGTAIGTEGSHTLTVHSVDAAGNTADATVTLLIDKTGPVITFFDGNKELLPSVEKHKFKEQPSITIVVTDEHSTPTKTVKLNGTDYTSGTPIAEGIYTLTVQAADPLGNTEEATLKLLVDLTRPVVVLKEGVNLLPLSGAIFNHPLDVTADVDDLSTTVDTATLDGTEFLLTRTISEDGPHTLVVTAVDEVGWPGTATSTFTIDTKKPVVSVFEGTSELYDGRSFARDVKLTAKADDITTVQFTATLDGADYTLGTLITADGTHTIVVKGTDAAGNQSVPVTLKFHIERANPEVRLKESGQPFPAAHSFDRDIVATIEVEAATTWTSDAKIDGSAYTLGTPYGVEGRNHKLVVVVTTAAGNSTPVEIEFEIDKTKPTIRLLANGAPMADGQAFKADFTPVVEAADNLTDPPTVVITLDGQTLEAGTVISEEKKTHTISATATDRAGNSASAGPFTFSLDKSDPTVTVMVDGKALENGALFKAPITPLIKADDLTSAEITATLDGSSYTLDTPISGDGPHSLVVTAVDPHEHDTVVSRTFIIDTTAPIVTVVESIDGVDHPFETGKKYERKVTPILRVVDTTDYQVIATLDGNSYHPGDDITSEGEHELLVIVTDDLGWVTPVPSIKFKIDIGDPVIKVFDVYETKEPLVSGKTFKRDVKPRIEVTDATHTDVVATLNGQTFHSEDLVSTDGRYTLNVSATDELGHPGTIDPISFVIDKTAPVVVITERGLTFNDGTFLDHDAVPLAAYTDLSEVDFIATMDGISYEFGTPVTGEGPHTLIWFARDAMGWATSEATIRFVVDKTAPVVTITDQGQPLEPKTFGRTVTPVINITDISHTTTVATIDGQAFHSGDAVSAEGSHTLAVTVTDDAGTPTVVDPITFVIDKTPPTVRVLEDGVELVSGKKFNRPVLPQIVIEDATGTSISAKLGDATYKPDTLIETEGTLTLSVTVTDAGGNSTPHPPITFVIDRTHPVVTITEAGVPFTGGAFKRSVKPEIAIQDITSTDTVATLNGAEFIFGAEITAERRYTLNVTVTDSVGWPTVVPTIGFAIDLTPPIVELVVDGKPLENGAIFNHAVEPRAIIEDTTDTTVTATLNGAEYKLGTPITAEGEYTLAVNVVDEVGLPGVVPTVTFRIDTTRPVLSFITPANQQALAAPHVLVTGNSDDSVTVEVNGVAAELDRATKHFTVPSLELLEGPNTIVAIGTDAAGNISDPVSVEVSVDTRAPEVTIASPAANACLTTRQVQVSGAISDPNIASVSIAILPGTTPAVTATLSADKRSWSATLQFPTEGKFVVAATARDNSGHEAVATVQVRIDETKPRIEITESGTPFIAPFVNRTVAPFVRSVDADPTTILTVTLDGAAYVSGTPIAQEKSYELKATATDCAGNKADDAIVRFTIDKTAPQFLTLSPANSASIGSLPTVSGTVSPDTVSVTVEENGSAATVSNGSFSFPALTVNEGANRFTLVAVDRAGNTARLDYSFNVKTSAPTVSIVENGSAIVSGTRYSRAVTVDVVSNEADAIVTATHNGQPFTSGATISDNGSHTISATARDSFGHTSPASEVTFTIDHEGPVVTITEPVDGATVTAATVRVRGTVTGDPASATINGAPLPLVGGAFDAQVALETGLNDITVIALDAAGNSGVGRIEVTRGGGTLGLILNSPIASQPTNRRTTIVAGQVLTHAGVSFVTVNGIQVPIDAAGAFRKTDFPLTEGPNVITATVRKDGAEGSVSVTVTADFTPPAIVVRESGNALEDEARFATQAQITVTATDAGQSITPTLLIDAAPAVSPAIVTVNGGHTLVALARDAAGNETRVERTFFIGGGATGGCALADFDPADGALITADHVTLIGRTGGAPGVKVNGTAAVVSNGSFSATVNLPVEGANEVNVTCTDANGAATGQPKKITLTRVTGAPSITITEPAHNSVTATEVNTVRGTIAGEVSQVTVNGSAATITGNTFSAPNVRLSSGVNVVVARARNAAGRTATDSVHVTWLKNSPAITITSPTTALTVRTPTLDVSGVWTNLDPASVTVTRGGNAAGVQTVVTSDTTGTFVAASVPLATGLQTITVRGLDRLGRAATATIDVTRAEGKPSIVITEPTDNTFFGSGAGATFTVRGTFDAETAATVEVNGENATLQGSTFTAAVPFSSLLNTPVVARVTELTGTFAIDTIRVSKLGAAPKVVETFPDADAVDVDAGTLPLVLFSAAMDRASVRSAFRLENAAGTAVSGDVVLDRDVLTFAPAALLTPGERFTMRIAATAEDLAGNAMGTAFARSFTVAATAPVTAPTLNAHASRVCGSLELTGIAPPNVRVRIDLGTLTFNTSASATGTFAFTLPLSGRSGFQVARVRVVGSDGSLSAAAEAQFEVDCAGPQVTNATYDRGTNALTITFSKAINIATVTTGATGSVRLQLTDGTIIGGTVSALAAASSVSIVPAQNLTEQSFTLTVTTAVQDTSGTALTASYSRAFTIGEPTLGDGAGYISGEVFDADTGRPLPGASVSIDVPLGAFARPAGTQSAARIPEIGATAAVVGIADNRGRYLRELPEGAHTIRASADNYTTVWRQTIVRTGAGVIPTDIRLTPRGVTKSGNGAALVLNHGGAPATPLALPAELRIPAGMIASGNSVTLTSVGAQSLAGLLPLGWSPLASAEIVSNAASLSGAELELTVPAQSINSAGQTLTAVRYFDDRDEWRVVLAVVPIDGDKAKIPVSAAGAYALVYRDMDPRLAKPADPVGGGALPGVADPCLAVPSPCAPLAAKEALQLVPPIVLPTQRTVATLRIKGNETSLFPSGTAVQAYVDEELRLADGTRDVVAPFATDLLLYRNLTGDTGEAVFHLAPSARASEVVLEIGYDHIRIVPYPERLDRGALIGPEGGRVPADDRVAVEIPAGATTDALSATAVSIKDFAPYGTIPGYRIVGGLTLSLQWAGQGSESSPVELVKPARATFTVSDTSLPSQLILVEVLEGTSYGRLFRLASQITALEGGSRFSTKTIDRAVLPVDGIIREGRYLLLAPNAPIAFATGTVHLGTSGPAINNARVLTPSLGVVDLTRITGIFNVPVPAAVFALIPRTLATGDGATYNHPTAPALDAIVNVGMLSIVAQPPTVTMTVMAQRENGLAEVTAEGAADVVTNTSVKASFSPGLDPQSAGLNAITVINDEDGSLVPGRAAAQGSTAILWTLEPGTRLKAGTSYTAIVAPGVRGANGTPVGGAVVASFKTLATLVSPGNVDPSKIRITVPDAHGHARIIGAPGALTEGWNAVAVRRFRDFSNHPQKVADAQRSFLIELGTGNDPLNRVTIADEIYLQIINTAGSVAAIVPLGPFTTDDGRGFVTSTDKPSTFTTVDNVTIAVPAGAFDTPTLVRLDPAAKAAFEDVPGFNEELSYFSGFKVDFEGVAKKRLDITFPAPAGLPAGKTPLLGYHGLSSQGPRIMVTNLLRRDGDKLTTTLASDGSASPIRTQSVRSEAIINPTNLRDMLMGIDRGALIIGFTFQTSVSWITFPSPPHPPDFFVPPLKSIYYASFAAERPDLLIPVAAGGAFNVIGIDPGSGLEVFNAPYTALQPGEPNVPTGVTLPATNEQGPYPVFTSPGRVETLEISTSDSFTDESIRNLKAEFNGSQVTFSNAATPLPANTHVEVINLRSSAKVDNDNFSSLSISAKQGDRLIVLISDKDVDPNTNVTVVFSEPIDTAGDLRDVIQLWVRDPSVTSSTFQQVPRDLIRIEKNSGDRRISVIFRGGYQRGKQYRLKLLKSIKDVGVGLQLQLGQSASGTPLAAGPALSGDLHLDFTVRAPKGLLSTFNINAGVVRDLAMVGNILFISAQEGGIFAYDASNPLMMGSAPAFAHIAAPVGSGGANWGLTSDIHGRLYATAVTNMYGIVRSYRVEDLTDCGITGSCPNPLVTVPPSGDLSQPPKIQHGNAIITWRTGINVGMPLASMIVGGWPEAIPRKIRVITRDSEPEVHTFEDLAGAGSDAGNGFRSGQVVVAADSRPYEIQRITVVNVTRDYRWSADVKGSKTFTIFGQPSDEIHIIKNLSTVGAVALYGYGVGVYDLDAMDANFRHLFDSAWERMEDEYVLSDGQGADAVDCDRAQQATQGRSCEIGALTFAPDVAATVIGDTASILVVEQYKGLLHLTMSAGGTPATFGRPGSMVFAEKLPVAGGYFGHPRINRLRSLYKAASGGSLPQPRYATVDTFKKNGTTYALVSALDYGVMVVRLDPKMKASSLVDVVWIPAGAQSVRVAQSQDYAVVVDGKGRVLLINLAGLDESSLVAQTGLSCGNVTCEWPLFPTAAAAIAGPSAPDEVGSDDPRIVWKSPDRPINDPLVFGTIPPIFDSETGFVYSGNVLDTKMRVTSAGDPKLRFIGQTGVGASPTSMKLLDRIVPLGIKPPDGSVASPNGSLAAFRLQTLVPGSMDESPGGSTPPSIILDTERVLGVASPQTPEPLPRSRFRETGPRPVTSFDLVRDAPDPTTVDVKRLRYNRGWNRMVTPWIVAIADPRASEQYKWSAATTNDEKAKAGCFACERPDHLKDLPEPRVFELFTAGGIISAKPGIGSLAGDWAWLGQEHRLETRVNTVSADTLRPTEVVLPGHNPPVVLGAMQETYYAHSGELETTSVDLNAGGRAGVDVVVDRTYRSRTLGSTAFGWGWDSPMFQRIRLLPTGNAEYRDGRGNVWVFEKPATGAGVTYTAPKGCYLKLQSTTQGWSLFDPDWNITKFDSYGRIVSYSDRLVDTDPKTGNTIRFTYNGLSQLSSVIDPYGRATSLLYWTEADLSTSGASPGSVRTITDWRDRKIDYEYDGNGTLKTVRLPESIGDSTLGSDFTFTGSRRPKIEYIYDTAAGSSSVNDDLELRTNLKSIEDPAEALKPDGKPRVSFAYNGPKHDHIQSETSTLPECSGGSCGVVTFTYPAAEQMEVVDLLGQTRLFEVTIDTLYDKRKHLFKVVQKQVPAVAAVDGDLASHDKALLNESMPLVDLETRFKYDDEGEVKEITHPNGLVTEIGYLPRPQGAARQMVQTIDQKVSGLSVMAATFDYYSKLRDQNLVKSITRRGSPVSPAITREVPLPRLDELVTTVADDDAEVRTEHDVHGRPTVTKRTAPGGAGLEQKTKTDYHDSGSKIALGMPKLVESGDGAAGGTSVTSTYATMPGAGYSNEIVDTVRDVTQTDEYDAYGRLTSHKIVGAAGVFADEHFGYDAEGRLLLHRRKQTKAAGGDVVNETYEYDLFGRTTDIVTDKANVNGASASVTVQRKYNIADRVTTIYDPFVSSPGIFTVVQSDRLGRVARTERSGGSSLVRKSFGYDRQGALAYETDGVRMAVLHQQDVFGRNVESLGSDGTRMSRTWDAWNQLTSMTTKGATGSVTPTAEVVDHSHFKYSTYGRPNGVARGVSSGVFLTTRSDLSFDGKTDIVRTAQTSVPMTTIGIDPDAILRTTRTVRDNAGRVVSQLSGEGRFAQMDANSTYAETNVVSFQGSVPQTVTKKEPRAGATYTTSSVFDALGRPIEVHEAGGAYVSTNGYDEAGNVITSQSAGYPVPWRNTYDSRGLVIRTEAPEGKITRSEYDARGIMRRFVDEAGKDTIYDTDGLGRVSKVTYADTTTEEMVYEDVTGLLASTKDRKGQWLSYFYDAAGRVTEVRLGGPRSTDPATPPVGDPFLRYIYDLGGRLRQVASRDAAIEYEAYDLLGRPGRTRSVRYKDHGGLGASAEILDAHTQGHVWAIHEGERQRWRMPVSGATLPATETASLWRTWVDEERDAASNISRQRAADDATSAAGAAITVADGRGFGRLKSRLRFYGNIGNALDQTYGYADGTAGSAPGPAAGQLGISRIKSGTFDVAGSQIVRDDARRASLTSDFGMPGRWSDFSYDDRGRLSTSSLLWTTGSAPSPTIETLQHADFRQARTVTTDASDLAELGSMAPQFLPQSWTATQNDVHQFVERTVTTEPAPRVYTFEGGRRTSDGVWSSEFDEEGRLIAIQRSSERIEYTYNPSGRVVGRRALRQTGGGFLPEDRQATLDADGLPAETTWVWDPIVDRLVAIFETGKSMGAAAPAPDAGLVRQYIHSDQGYDDPVEVTVKHADGSVRRYLPLVDQAGAGSVQAILSSQSGLLAERVLYADAYGDAPRYLQGAVVDKIQVEPTKAGDGSVEKVLVRVRLSETVDATTLASGLRVSTLNAAGSVVTTAVGTVESDGATVTMTIGGTEWTSLTTASGATQLEIAVTNTLRAALWEGPVMPMPAWLLDGPGRASTTQFPVIQRKSLDSLGTFIDAIPSGGSEAETLLAIHNVYLAASPVSTTKLLTGFKASPFVEPRSGFAFFRARWYSPQDGTWLTGDPFGPIDSSNLHAAFACDPVNGFDPTGNVVETVWDAASLGLGIYQISQWDENTSGWAKALDVVGVAADTAAVVLPFIPGGVGAGLKAYRAADAAHDLYTTGRTLDRALDTIQGIDQGLNTIQAGLNIAEDVNTGNIGWGTGLNALQYGIGFRSLSTRGIGGYRLDFSGGHATASMNGLGGVGIKKRAGDWQAYEARVANLYGGRQSFNRRRYQTVLDGEYVTGIADNVAKIDGLDFAVEAKFVRNWATSIRNPQSPLALGTRFSFGKTIAAREQARMLEQARKYSEGFPGGVIYHSNSQSLIDHYSRVFREAGLTKFRFVLTE
jgi:RHS repeat-associated protein